MGRVADLVAVGDGLDDRLDVAGLFEGRPEVHEGLLDERGGVGGGAGEGDGGVVFVVAHVVQERGEGHDRGVVEDGGVGGLLGGEDVLG